VVYPPADGEVGPGQERGDDVNIVFIRAESMAPPTRFLVPAAPGWVP
jgi:hypothetical protein